MNNFNQIYKGILCEINKSIIKMNFIPFNDLVRKIILEDYHIFPVPKLLLDDIENFTKTNINELFKENNLIVKKEYSFKDLLKNYAKDWDYYNEFAENAKELNKLNKNGKIICCLVFNENQIDKVISTYQLDVSSWQISNSKACVFSCNNSDDFNVCLCINIRNGIQTLRKCIQHELIHWMQVSLNVHTKTTRGIFNDKKFSLPNNDIEILSNYLNMSETEFIQTYEYLLGGREFEAWVANTCEEFESSGLTVEEYKNIIENNNKFINAIYSTGQDENKFEMFLFGKICQMSSMNDKSDDRYWYLIEALKENK